MGNHCERYSSLIERLSLEEIKYLKKLEFYKLPADERITVYKRFDIAKSGNEICKAVREGTVTLKIDRSIEGIKKSDRGGIYYVTRIFPGLKMQLKITHKGNEKARFYEVEKMLHPNNEFDKAFIHNPNLNIVQNGDRLVTFNGQEIQDLKEFARNTKEATKAFLLEFYRPPKRFSIEYTTERPTWKFKDADSFGNVIVPAYNIKNVGNNKVLKGDRVLEINQKDAFCVQVANQLLHNEPLPITIKFSRYQQSKYDASINVSTKCNEQYNVNAFLPFIFRFI